MIFENACLKIEACHLYDELLVEKENVNKV